MATIPDKPGLEGLEATWGKRWDADGIYRFDRTQARDAVFSIDTPPPTVSGSLHVGSACSYTHTDTVARYQRMRGRAVYYPMGWDDNGLPTERRVQNYFGVRCDPSRHYEEDDFEIPAKAGNLPSSHRAVPISRKRFLELCERLVAEDEVKFEGLWRALGLSVDWSYTYTTIGESARRTSQRAFLRNLARDEAYQADAPTLWDVDDQTAIAQAEMEDKETPGAYHRLAFHRSGGATSPSGREPQASGGATSPSGREPQASGGGNDVVIETTRPELLAACVALVAHPDDDRYAPLFGTMVRTPLYDVEVPVVAHRLADPEKGSGIAMICTFGDTTDVIWWRELQLPTRTIVGKDGRIIASPPDGLVAPDGVTRYEEIAGKSVKQAQARVVEQLAETGELLGEPRPITHPVKFYERGKRPLEIVASRQWYIRNGGRDAERRDAFLQRARELNWVPSYMKARYDSWVEGLTGDWLISRQRYFGVPIPVWYRVDGEGNVDYDDRIVPNESTLPVDPYAEPAPGFDESQRGKANGFVGDGDVMDTWATSSLTPLIVCAWADDTDLFERTYPMDMRPQAYEIIRTWLFSTVVRSHYETDSLPWKHAAISGWVLDPDRKKMSKSKGNVVGPMDWIEKYGADALRYWAGSARPGTDTAFEEAQLKIGRKLAIKLLNVSKFVLNVAGDATPNPTRVTHPLDRSMLAQLAHVVEEATGAFEGFDYARALERTESFFWRFCDDYVELVKSRAYRDEGGDDEGSASARAALLVALSNLQRLFAPFLCYATEEVWSWWHDASVHREAWPTSDGLGGGDPLVFDTASQVIGRVRGYKSEMKISLATELATLHIDGAAQQLAALELARADVCATAKISAGALTTQEATDLGVVATHTPA